MIKDGNGFKWIKLSILNESMEKAKAFLNENYEAINKKYDLYQQS